MMEQIATELASIAKMLGLAVPLLWPKAVWAFWLSNLISIILVSVALCGHLFVFGWFLRSVRDTETSSVAETLYSIGVTCSGVIAGVLIVVSLIAGGDVISALIEPEGAYVRQVIERLDRTR